MVDEKNVDEHSGMSTNEKIAVAVTTLAGGVGGVPGALGGFAAGHAAVRAKAALDARGKSTSQE